METEIKPGRYKKRILLRWIREISIIFWRPGAFTPDHDHSVQELTFVVWRRIFQIVEGQKTYHRRWTLIRVPVGIFHTVGVDKKDGRAITINYCFGIMKMNTRTIPSVLA